MTKQQSGQPICYSISQYYFTPLRECVCVCVASHSRFLFLPPMTQKILISSRIIPIYTRSKFRFANSTRDSVIVYLISLNILFYICDNFIVAHL